MTDDVAANQNGMNGATSSPGWPLPEPFEERDLPPFPVDALARWQGEWVVAEAEALQVPVDLPAMLSLGVISLAAAKNIEIEVGTGWCEPPNLYIAVALRSGEAKSPAHRAATRPVYDFQEMLRRRWLDEVAALKAASAEAPKPRGRPEPLLELPPEPRLIADDATPEAIAKLLAEQGERLAILSTEGGIFELLAGRYSDRPNLDLFLKAHDGDPHAVDRVKGVPIYLRAPLLTVAVAVQPHVIAGLADKPGFRGLGLLGRFLYSIPKSRVGYRNVDPAPVGEEISAGYGSATRRLLALAVAESNESGERVPRVLRLDDAARAALLRFKGALEPRMAVGADLNFFADWTNKLAGRVARIAGLLHLADSAADAEGEIGEVIAESTMIRAVRVGEYLIPHAVAALTSMAADPAIEDARNAVDWMRRKRLLKFSRRDLHRALQGRVARSADVDPILEMLSERAFVRAAPPPSGGRGRPQSPVFLVNPRWTATWNTSMQGEENDGQSRQQAK
jgi:replicative DNA helicase